MFDSDGVDDDYFTPVAKTSLASIFKKPLTGKKAENETLKYTPPTAKPAHQNDEPTKRPYETVYSCVFDAYLWMDNVYTNKGKLGCAVVKHNTLETQSFHSILLYDSKKATVSSAIATKELEVTLKGNNVISYYDRYEKYWCLHGSEDDINQMVNVLKTCNVNVKVLNGKDNSIPKQNQNKECNVETFTIKKTTESDTDSSVNRKTKASILSRMANMGQSVLPPHISNEQSSDSSDTNECNTQVVALRHKPAKNIKKISDKNILDLHKRGDVQKKPFIPTTQPLENTKCIGAESQIIPFQSSVTITSKSGQDMNYFFTEQRIANSELRINMSRITDKVDGILNKVNNLDREKHEGNHINTEIFQKLIKEYESKIKAYEELLQKENNDKTSVLKQDIPTEKADKDELVELNSKICELNNCIKQREAEITRLKTVIIELNGAGKTSESEIFLQSKLSEVEKTLNEQDEMMREKDELVKRLKERKDQIEHKIKRVMNDTFRAIEINFDDNESYSGKAIKNIVATVIKRVTIESLSDAK